MINDAVIVGVVCAVAGLTAAEIRRRLGNSSKLELFGCAGVATLAGVVADSYGVDGSVLAICFLLCALLIARLVAVEARDSGVRGLSGDVGYTIVAAALPGLGAAHVVSFASLDANARSLFAVCILSASVVAVLIRAWVATKSTTQTPAYFEGFDAPVADAEQARRRNETSLTKLAPVAAFAISASTTWLLRGWLEPAPDSLEAIVLGVAAAAGLVAGVRFATSIRLSNRVGLSDFTIGPFIAAGPFFWVLRTLVV